MSKLAARLQEEIETRLAATAADEGVLHLADREVRFFRGEDGFARAKAALYGLASREMTVVPPVEIVPGTWCLIL